MTYWNQRYVSGELMNEVWKDVWKEPSLLSRTGERINTSVNTSKHRSKDFWIPHQQVLFDVTVFDSYAQIHWTKNVDKMLQTN